MISQRARHCKPRFAWEGLSVFRNTERRRSQQDNERQAPHGVHNTDDWWGFQLTTNGVLTTLASFNDSDGANPTVIKLMGHSMTLSCRLDATFAALADAHLRSSSYGGQPSLSALLSAKLESRTEIAPVFSWPCASTFAGRRLNCPANGIDMAAVSQ